MGGPEDTPESPDNTTGSIPSEGGASEPPEVPVIRYEDLPNETPEEIKRADRLRRAAKKAGKLAWRGYATFSDRVADRATFGKFGPIAKSKKTQDSLGENAQAAPEEEQVSEELAEDIGEVAVEEAVAAPETKEQAEESLIDTGDELHAAVEEQPEETTDKLKPGIGAIETYLQSRGLSPRVIEEAKKIVVADADTLLNRFLSETGIEEAKTEEVSELIKASHVRLMMAELKELGLAEDKVDEAHRILVSEKGRLRIKHIVALGFGPENAERVHEILTSSPAKLLREELENTGLDEDKINEIIGVGDDQEKLIRGELSRLGLSEGAIDHLLQLEGRAQQEQERAEEAERIKQEVRKELGYTDDEKINHAHKIGISDEAIKRAEIVGYPLDLLIASVEDEDTGLRDLLRNHGIEIGNRDEEPEVWSRKKVRKAHRRLSKVPSLYPYPPEHPLYGLGYSDYPHMITRGETDYYKDRMKNSPGRLRNSLRRPGSLPLPDFLYYNRLTRPFLDVANILWCPIGKRQLANKLYEFERSRHPEEDYGMLGRGLEKRNEQREHVDLVDATIIEDRSLLSWHRRHRDRGDIRRNPRLDLAQSIAETKRDMYAFERGRPSLPTEKEVEEERLASKETYDRLRKLPEDKLNDKQKELLIKLAAEHPEWG